MRDDVIYLVAKDYDTNKYGVLVPRAKKHKVYCKETSVSASEWFEGSRAGLNPEYRFKMFPPDYKGEDTVEYKGKLYSIYRTFERDADTIELYVERKKGAL